MGLEPAFARSTVAWPLAGGGAWPAEPDDPDFTIPHGALRICIRDTPDKTYIADLNPRLVGAATEPLAPARPVVSARRQKWLAAIAVSCVLHAAVAMFFLTRDDDAVLIEGSANAGITLLGNAADDQASSGDISDTVTNVTLITMLDAKPVETIDAQAVTDAEVVEAVETVAVETPVTEALEPVVETAQQAPTPERLQPTPDAPAPTATVDPLPEILATDTINPVEDDNVVQKPVEQVKVEPVEPAEVTPAEKPEKTVVAGADPKPEPKPEAKKPSEKPAAKPVKKTAKPEKTQKAAKPAEKPGKEVARSGSGGSNQADTRRGSDDGQADGTTTTKGKSGNSASAGNAAVSNYPGTVVAKLRRALRGIPRGARAKAQNDVHVGFIVNASGSVGSVRIVQSSGSADLDQAAMETVRRAAPFPPIPPEAGRSSWQFTLPLGLAR